MPLLIARQWQVLKGAPATISALCRSPRLCRPAVATTSRWYTQQINSNKKRFSRKKVPLNGAIIIPSSVLNVQSTHLIKLIDPVPRERVAKDCFCVFFVTPSFAPWLFKDEVFLEHALLRAYSNLWDETNDTNTPPLQIHALCAVVDKLPAARAFKLGDTLADAISRRTAEPPVAETGYEGIAYATLPATASVSSTAPSSVEKGAVDFIVKEHTADANHSSDILRLPLANTVFQTGTPTTMTFSKWKPCHTTKRLELVSKSKISHHGIRILGRDRADDHVISALSIPLVPLTFPRGVEGCMGNIVRRLVGPGGDSITASSELERAVPRFFKSRGESAQATTAWALVIPRSMLKLIDARTRRLLARLLARSEAGEDKRDELWERLWRRNPPLWNNIVSSALAEGARLHRVLSGGGGWGKKAGLLSLDPVPTTEDMHQLNTGDPPSLLADPEDFASTLTPVVEEGDSIQFFVSPSVDKHAEDHLNGLQKLEAFPKHHAWGWEFGTTPSTVDSIPDESWQHTTSSSNRVHVFRHAFGALAEGGLMLTRRFPAKEGKSVPSMGTTVVDVPFSRFWATDVSDGGGLNEDAANEYLEEVSDSATSLTYDQSIKHHTENEIDKGTSPMGSMPSLFNLPLSVRSPKVERIVPIRFARSLSSKASSSVAPQSPRKGLTFIIQQPDIPVRPLVHKVTSKRPKLPPESPRIRFEARATSELQTANKRARGIEGAIRRLKVEYKVVMLTTRQRTTVQRTTGQRTTGQRVRSVLSGSLNQPGKIVQQPIRESSTTETGSLPELSGLSAPLLPRTALTEDALDSRIAINKLGRIGKKIARLTAEHNVIMFSMGQRVRFVRSGTDIIRALEQPEEITQLPTSETELSNELPKITAPDSISRHAVEHALKSRTADRKLQRIVKRIKDLKAEHAVVMFGVDQRVRFVRTQGESLARIMRWLKSSLNEDTRETRKQYQQEKTLRQGSERASISAGPRIRKTLMGRRRRPRIQKVVDGRTRRLAIRKYDSDIIRRVQNRKAIRTVTQVAPLRAGRKQRRDEFAARVGSWLGGVLGASSPDSASVDVETGAETAKDEPTFGKHSELLDEGCADLKDASKQDVLKLLLETAVKQDRASTSGGRRRRRL